MYVSILQHYAILQPIKQILYNFILSVNLESFCGLGVVIIVRKEKE